jgi:ATP-dependent exoDNAse (exonuclease V) beta subunit
MSRSPLRPATVPHTHKSPGECPHCGSRAITRKGVRKKKLEIVQLWRCASCKRTFTPGPAALRNIKENTATATAGFIIPAVGANKLRHETLQNFMLANDSSTIAVEIPIWLTEDEIANLETRYGIELAAGGAPRSITGHIDFLQVRNDAVHILDYKPDARTNKPIAQLAIYALALTVRVPGLKLFDIKCAWFNGEEYNEFFPRTLFAKR